MTITRTINGEQITIELTDNEVWEAHLEATDRCDRDDCKAYIEDYCNEEQIEQIEAEYLDLEEAVDEMLEQFHEIMYYGCDEVSRQSALEQAFDRLI